MTIFKHINSFTLLIILSILLSFCKSDKPSDEARYQALTDLEAKWFKNDDFPYHLKSPTAELKMSMMLKEISGLTYVKETNQLAAINDELGNVFFLNSTTGKIERKIRFQRFGDYEAVESVNGQYYVCNSKGELRLITLNEKVDVEIFKTRLGYENNVEGMGYDEARGLLYLACKDLSLIHI